MKKFLIKVIFGFLMFILVNAMLVCLVPKDQNNYYFAWKDKIERLQSLQSPRLILVGGSSVVYSTDTKMLGDSLGMTAYNMGLHAGIGIKYPVDDLLQYIRKGDIVVLQIEYPNLVSGGNGDPENLPEFMVINDWHGFSHLTTGQWSSIARGLPFVALGNLKRIIKRCIGRSWNHASMGPTYEYGRDGFNYYGDEIMHYKYPDKTIILPEKKDKRPISEKFVTWLFAVKNKYEQAGAQIILMPPVCIESQFKLDYNEEYMEKLRKLGCPYIVDPRNMIQPDSLAFDTGYHMNVEGTRRNSLNMIKVLKPIVCSKN